MFYKSCVDTSTLPCFLWELLNNFSAVDPQLPKEFAAEAVASNLPLLFEAVEALNISPDEDIRIDDPFICQYLLKSCIELPLVDFS